MRIYILTSIVLGLISITSCTGNKPSSSAIDSAIHKKIIKNAGDKFEIQRVSEVTQTKETLELGGAKADSIKYKFNVVVSAKSDCVTGAKPQTEYKTIPGCYTVTEYEEAKKNVESSDMNRAIASTVIINEFTRSSKTKIQAGEEFVFKDVSVNCLYDHTSKNPEWKCQ